MVIASIPTQITSTTQRQPFDIETGQVESAGSSTEMRSFSPKGILAGVGLTGVLAGSVVLGLEIGHHINYMRRPRPSPSPTPSPSPIFGAKSIDIQCNPSDTDLILLSHQSISRNIFSILNITSNIKELSIENQDNLKTCFEDSDKSCVTYVCKDEPGDYCDIANNTLGFYSGNAFDSAAIFICIDNISRHFGEDQKAFFCQLDEVLVHEVAHYIGVPMGPDGHNHKDPVYQVGYAANEVCQHDTVV